MRLINVPPWVRRWGFIAPPVILGRIGFELFRADPFGMPSVSAVLGLAVFGLGVGLGVYLFRKAWY